MISQQISSTGRWLDWLYGASMLRRQAERQYPDEPIIFASGGLLTRKRQIDDELQRVSGNARRGAWIITPNRLIFASHFLMPMNLFFMAVALGAGVLWLQGGGFLALVLAAIGVASVIRRRPYRLEIPVKRLERVTVKSVGAATGAYHSVIIHAEGAAYQVVATAQIPPEARAFLLEL